VHRDHPRGHLHIDTEIEVIEEDPMETSDDESVEDKTYRMSLMPPSENSAEEDDESNDTWVGHKAVEEEGRFERTLNPYSHRKDPFHPSPTICFPHKSLRYVVANYKGKGATKKVKKLQKFDPRSHQKDASDYRFHTHFR
jgi:hypothetical protein